jgi:hypothetical protein
MQKQYNPKDMYGYMSLNTQQASRVSTAIVDINQYLCKCKVLYN